MPDPKFEGRTAREIDDRHWPVRIDSDYVEHDTFSVDPLDKGRVCFRCGDKEWRVKGYCSSDCRDRHEYEEEIEELKAQRDEAVGLLKECREIIAVDVDVSPTNPTYIETVWRDLLARIAKLLARIDSRGDGGRGVG